MVGSNRRPKRTDAQKRRNAKSEAGDARRFFQARFAHRAKTFVLFAAAAGVVGTTVYALNRPQAPLQQPNTIIASAPPAASLSQTRSLTSATPPSAPDEAAKARKPARRDPPALGQDDPAIDRWFVEAYLHCWSPPTKIPDDRDYAAKIRVLHNADGSLAGAPVLVNPPSDPDWRTYAQSAVQAVKKCNPLAVPAEYAPRFDHWRKVTLYFSPDSAHE